MVLCIVRSQAGCFDEDLAFSTLAVVVWLRRSQIQLARVDLSGLDAPQLWQILLALVKVVLLGRGLERLAIGLVDLGLVLDLLCGGTLLQAFLGGLRDEPGAASLDQDAARLRTMLCNFYEIGRRWQLLLGHAAVARLLPQPVDDALVAHPVSISVETRVQLLHNVHDLAVHAIVLVVGDRALRLRQVIALHVHGLELLFQFEDVAGGALPRVTAGVL